ncbi:hypothetical protein M436DRAFT_64336 [Aureobasidium namibiae CBS 147.97]|uniref:Uncharacterized protein n=1 Tax=Aureobasidium namibiae CBS 147.97 TaxID=1043004 RepID=A0A074XCG6_9PEZI
MKLTCFSWLDCQHTITHDESGTRMGIAEIMNPSNQPIDQKMATFPCPACTDPDANQDGVGIRPRVQEASTALTAPGLTVPAVMQNNTLNPNVSEFRPSTRQRDDSVNNSFRATGRDSSMTGTGAPTRYISQNMGGTVYFLRAIDSDHEDPQQELMQQSFPSTANQVPMQQSFPSYANHELMQHPFPSSAITNYDRRNMHLTQPMVTTARGAHKSGNPCPDGCGWCHWHYARWCHEDPATCYQAQQAITAAFYAHSEWKYAPMGWNAAHESCTVKEMGTSNQATSKNFKPPTTAERNIRRSRRRCMRMKQNMKDTEDEQREKRAEMSTQEDIRDSIKSHRRHVMEEEEEEAEVAVSTETERNHRREERESYGTSSFYHLPPDHLTVLQLQLRGPNGTPPSVMIALSILPIRCATHAIPHTVCRHPPSPRETPLETTRSRPETHTSVACLHTQFHTAAAAQASSRVPSLALR